MKYTNLAESPVYYKDTIKLIESAFDYSSNNSFDIDFYPLMCEKNQKNCHLIIKDNKVVAHIGVLEKEITLNNKSYPLAMYGGIAVHKNFRGQGLFKDLFNLVLKKYEHSSLHLLWSDQLEMYAKFGFVPAIEQIEFNESLNDAEIFTPTKLSLLSDEEIHSLYSIYKSSSELRVSRTLEDWEELKKITSTDLYIKKVNEKIVNYFFINKGEDLNGVIFEVGDFRDIKEINNYGITWSPYDFEQEDIDKLFAAVLKIGNNKNFISFITNYTQEHIKIINIESDSVKFTFEENNFELSHQDFLTGVFGPNRFEELSGLKPLYISGLDSI